MQTGATHDELRSKPTTKTVKLLKSLDAVIAEHGLHSGDPRVPVCPDVLLEAAIVGYCELPEPVLAISVQWDGDAGITLNSDLREPAQSAQKRHATAHEFGHIFLRHRGYYTLYRDGGECAGRDNFGRYLLRYQERECEIVSAYVLVRREALRLLEGQEAAYVARVLDVPRHLVDLRWNTLGKFGQ